MTKHFILVSFSAIAFCASAQVTKKALFIGDANTGYYDVPALTDSIARSFGQVLVYEKSSPSTHSLQNHSTNSTTLSLFSANNWDFVAIQEQVFKASQPWGQVAIEVLPWATTLADEMRKTNSCAMPLFFQSWPLLQGDLSWDSTATFEKMNAQLRNTNEYLARANAGTLVPVGDAFNGCKEIGSPVETADLYDMDGEHASIYGAYLSACMFYEAIFGKNPVNNTFYPAGTNAASCQFLQQIAHLHMNPYGKKLKFAPQSDFTWNNDGSSLEVNFTNLSANATKPLSWLFGDGDVSSDPNPAHTYSEENLYYVTLISADDCGRSDTLTRSIYVAPSVGVQHTVMGISGIYPNPAHSSLHFKTTMPGMELNIFTPAGKRVFMQAIGERSTNLELELNPGLYFVKYGSSSTRLILQ